MSVRALACWLVYYNSDVLPGPGRHRDKPPADGWPLPNYRLIKVFVAIFDISEGGGGTVSTKKATQQVMENVCGKIWH
eukprot:SAG22_NODE_1695_length_3796_cov_3.361915_4_plen_78_part_00